MPESLTHLQNLTFFWTDVIAVRRMESGMPDTGWLYLYMQGREKPLKVLVAKVDIENAFYKWEMAKAEKERRDRASKRADP